jgi:iron complex transport system ATP-binding protein
LAAAISAQGITAGYGPDDVLLGVDLDLGDRELLGVLGPNGCGKSTLIRALTGILPLRSGNVRIHGDPLEHFSRRALARAVAVVPQRRDLLFSFTAFETVMMGRTPHLNRFQRERQSDRDKAEESLRATHALDLADRFVSDLSGGEQQRVHIARALAQDPRILLLDEPTTHLDINHQIEVFELLLRLRDQEGIAILCVSHDVNFAAEYCDRIVLMKAGRATAAAPPTEAITPESLREAYDVDLPVAVDQVSGRPHVVIRRTTGTLPAASPKEEEAK